MIPRAWVTGLRPCPMGPNAGATGPSLYMVVKNGPSFDLVGYYCEVNANFVRTQCFVEQYKYNAAAAAGTCLPPPRPEEPKACVTSGAGTTGAGAFVAIVIVVLGALLV